MDVVFNFKSHKFPYQTFTIHAQIHVYDFKCNFRFEIDKNLFMVHLCKFESNVFMIINKNVKFKDFLVNKSFSFLCGKGHGCMYTCDRIKI